MVNVRWDRTVADGRIVLEGGIVFGEDEGAIVAHHALCYCFSRSRQTASRARATFSA